MGMETLNLAANALWEACRVLYDFWLMGAIVVAACIFAWEALMESHRRVR